MKRQGPHLLVLVGPYFAIGPDGTWDVIELGRLLLREGRLPPTSSSLPTPGESELGLPGAGVVDAEGFGDGEKMRHSQLRADTLRRPLPELLLRLS